MGLHLGVVQAGGRLVVAVLAESPDPDEKTRRTLLVGLDPGRGQPLWPPQESVGPVMVPLPEARGHGAGGAQALVLTRDPNQPEIREGVRDSHLGGSFIRFSPQGWRLEVLPLAAAAALPATRQGGLHWPFVVDLQGNGSREVVVPFQRKPGAGDHPTETGIRVLDAASGQTRWERRLWLADWYDMENFKFDIWGEDRHAGRLVSPAMRFIVGPDLDGDGYRELFVASLGEDRADRTGECSLYVDALSGQDGRPLWWWRQPKAVLDRRNPRNRERSILLIGPLSWWQRGPDGWPQLLVSVDSELSPSEVDRWGHIWPRGVGTWAVSAGTGRLTSPSKVAETRGKL
jgi:hypothetical protein